MTNQYLDFYKKHNISPVHMTEASFEKHVMNRRNLYRQLGIPFQCFRGKNIVEFGPGGGINSLVLAHPNLGGACYIDLVEPNPTGYEEIIKLYDEFDIPKEKYCLNKCMLEEFESNKLYDFVIAEQFIPHIPNKEIAIKKLKTLVAEDGILIITAVDETGLYVEMMKRVVAHIITKDINDYKKKVEALLEIFSPALELMNNMTRPAIDWVQDQMIGPMILHDSPMNLKDAIALCEDEFDVLGASQNIFTDYSWYKDTEYDVNKVYKEQYNRKIQAFLLAGDDDESIVSELINGKLETAAKNANRLAAEMEQTNCWDRINDLIDYIRDVSQYAGKEKITLFNNELIEILGLARNNKYIDFSKYSNFNNTFGKSSQFISFQRKFRI